MLEAWRLTLCASHPLDQTMLPAIQKRSGMLAGLLSLN